MAGHPLHPALAHLPIGAWLAAAVWDAAAWMTGDPIWWRMAYLSIALGLVGAVLAAAVGFVDYLGLPADSRAEKTATRHLVVVLLATTSFFFSLLVRTGGGPLIGGTRLAALALTGAGLALLAVGGWLGGELVYHHGVGVSPPAEKDDRMMQ